MSGDATTFDAWWLPRPVEVSETIRAGELEVRYPAPDPGLLEQTVRSLRNAGRELTARPVAEIVAAVDAAAARLADPADPLRQEADRRVAAATGYSPQMTTLVLDRMAADWRADALEALLRAELGDPAVLDGFTPVSDGRRTRAYGPRMAFHVFAGNVPGVAVTSLVRALLVKAPSLGKLASGQPVLPVLFARALEAVDPDLARAIALTYWPGGAEEAERRVIEAADTVVVYGGEKAVASFRGRVPGRTRLVVHGPRFSIGLVGREALDDPALPARVARAVATFDQHGCVSPHAVWVEDDDGAASLHFAEAVAGAFQRLADELPRGRVTPPEAAAIQQERGAAEMRGHRTGGRIFRGAGTAWTVVHEPETVFRPSCLNRFLHVHPIDALEHAADLLAPWGDRLQSAALACADDRLARLAHLLASSGATRVTTFDRVPWPPPEWHHDGRGPLAELVRWVDLED